MAIQLYNPFLDLKLNPDECFLTGKKITSAEEQIYVFPEWIMDRYLLREKTFTMLGDGNITKYSSLRLPCSEAVIQALDPFEKEIEQAFSAGYDEVKKLPEERLFQWMAKLVYGILYNDLSTAIKEQNRRGERLSLSLYLRNRFRNLHLMLQSLVTPMEYKGFKPWSIEVVRIKYSKDVFNYKDETNKLNFSLGMNDFGIVCCLQDNGENSNYHKELMAKIGDRILHPVQFEELCGRFIYSNYLIKGSPEYTLQLGDDKVYVEPILAKQGQRTLFEPWEDEMFGQVLANYWKPWGIAMSDIIVFPNAPISFLLNDYTDELIEPESISLPY
ncbi:MAG TPA: hypothetical protein VNW06_12195 [Cytophagaceae bacterium]|jgi:hypothetical protein|nr:hypothetical protein [Cytophagaceae bacterium]